MRVRGIVKLSAALLALFSMAAGQAATITIDDGARGWYLDPDAIFAGLSNGRDENNNYAAGAATSQIGIARNWFAFDLSGIGPVSAATLRIFQPEGGYVSPDASETYTLFDIDENPATLGLGPDVGIYEDLGTGPILGSVDITAADDGSFIEIVLNDLGLAAINLNSPFPVAFGGGLTTISGFGEIVFAGSTDFPGAELILTTQVNAPATLGLFGLGLAGLLVVRRRARAAA